MNEDEASKSDYYAELRQKAEASFSDHTLEEVAGLSTEEIKRLVYELEVHQIELEMQNEELRHAQNQLAESRDQYAELYDFAPVGYLTISKKGLIERVNLTGANLLGVERDQLRNIPFSSFVSRAYQDAYYQHRRQTLNNKTVQTCELKLITKEGTEFDALMESVTVAEGKFRTILRDITERKQAREALLASERQYHQLVESLQEGVWVIDKNAHTTFVNQPLADMLGYTIDEMQGRHLFSFMNEAGVAATQRNLARRQEGIIEQHDFEFLRKDGSALFVAMETAPILDAEGNYDGAVAGLIDITERRRAEERLARLNACFLNFGPDPITNINQLTGLCGELLGADCALYNRLHQGMMCSWGQWQTPPDYNPIDNPEGHICYDVIQQAPNEAVIIRNLPETIYASTDPTVVPYGLQTYVGKAIKLEEDTVGSLCVVFMQDFVPTAEDLQIMDIIGSAIATEERRRQAEVSLKGAHEHLAATLNALPDLLFELDRDGRFHDFRAPNTQSLYVPPEQFLGKTVADVLPAEAADSIMAAIEAVATGGRHTGAIYAFDMLDGRRWYEASIAAKGDQDGGDGRFIALSRNITDRIQAENALRESNRHLEKALSDLKETQAQMVQQERQAAVGQLAAGIAHDFNNLMAAILLHAELLLMNTELTPKNRRKIELIYQQGQRAADLTQQILDFSRKSVMKRENLDLCLLLEEMSRLFSRTIPENIQLSLDCQVDTCPVNADSTRLQQAVLNLVINARDAMPNGGGLHIQLGQVVVEEGGERPYALLTPGQWAQLSITDSGTGITETVLEHIFEPFFTTKAPLGSGLGLSQVDGIIKQHDGFVDVVSTAGQGSAFSLYLPMLPLTQVAAALKRPDVALGQGEMILIVEDNELVRQSLVEVLELLNYRPFSVADGRAALAFFQSPENEVSLVITDLIMPGMGGEELLRILRQVDPELKTIIMTGYPLDDQGAEMLAAGANSWLPKPTSLHDLSQELARVLRM